MHKFIINELKAVYKDGNDYICSICGIKVFKSLQINSNEYIFYTIANKLSAYTTKEESEKITCEEFIIKSIIE